MSQIDQKWSIEVGIQIFQLCISSNHNPSTIKVHEMYEVSIQKTTRNHEAGGGGVEVNGTTSLCVQRASFIEVQMSLTKPFMASTVSPSLSIFFLRAWNSATLIEALDELVPLAPVLPRRKPLSVLSMGGGIHERSRGLTKTSESNFTWAPKIHSLFFVLIILDFPKLVLL